MTDASTSLTNKDHSYLQKWIHDRQVQEIELILPDMNGIIRGKVVPAQRFLHGVANSTHRIASSILYLTMTGDYPEMLDDRSPADEFNGSEDPDIVLMPDAASIRLAPGYRTPTATILTDACSHAGAPVDIAPRQVLKNVLALFEQRGWKPVIAPEVEFFLTARNIDPDLPLETPAGRSGRAEAVPQPYGLEALNEYEDLIEAIYEYTDAAELDLETMIHESGAAQLEVNFNHGDPLKLADQVLIFKRIVRQVALANGVYATFMAKPMDHQPGSAMHIHQSIVDAKTGENLFSERDGRDSALFRSYVAGLQTYLKECTPLFAPNVNSYRRMRPQHSAPINVQWGKDNRSCGLRVPVSDPQSRRIENRLPGADANPYLAIASSLACGYLGMVEQLTPSEQLTTSAYRLPRQLSRSLAGALDRFKHCAPIRSVVGEGFSRAFTLVKEAELDAFDGVVSAWEREHLLLKV